MKSLAPMGLTHPSWLLATGRLRVGEGKFMIEQVLEQEHSTEVSPSGVSLLAWREALREELNQTIVLGGGRWSRALMAVAWIHLIAFVGCHLLREPSRDGGSDPRHMLVWFAELVAVFVAMRIFAGKGWFWSPPSIKLITRLWVTLLILSFSVATLNHTIGWETLWFKAVWGTLSTFFFATLAWLFTPWFFVPAVGMYFTGLLIARFMAWNNVIYGVSWWIAMMGTAWVVRRRERRAAG
jgi:hypothetical protein